MIEEQVAKRAAAKDASVTEGLNAKAAALVTAPAGTAAAAAAPAKKTDVGTVAAIGVALGLHQHGAGGNLQQVCGTGALDSRGFDGPDSWPSLAPAC